MNIKIVKFHQPIYVGKNQLTTVNLLGVHNERYTAILDKGLVKITDSKPDKGWKEMPFTYVGLANVVYMIPVEETKKTTKK